MIKESKRRYSDLLLLLLRIWRGILLKCSIGDLKADQRGDTDVQNRNQDECNDKAHEDTYSSC